MYYDGFYSSQYLFLSFTLLQGTYTEPVFSGSCPSRDPLSHLKWAGRECGRGVSRGKKEAIFRSVLLEYIHMSCVNTFGMGELTAAIVKIPDILPKTH